MSLAARATALLAAIDALDSADADYRQKAVEELLKGVTPDWAMVALGADQTTNISVNNHIEFDLIEKAEGSGISLATGSGQADGLVTLPAGIRYRITLWSYAGINEGHLRLRLLDHDTGSIIDGDTGEPWPLSLWAFDAVALDAGAAHGGILFTPPDATVVKVEIVTVSNLVSINAGTRLWIQEVL